MEEINIEKKEETGQEPKKQSHPWEEPIEKKDIRQIKPEESIKIKKSTIWQIVSGILMLLLIISILTSGFGIMGRSGSPTGEVVKEADNQPAPQPRPEEPIAPKIDMKELVDDDAVEGKADAPITIVEWSDYECPYCARFYQQTYKQLKEKYIDTGKVKFIYRDFPLGFHANAQKAAETAECAGEQKKYYDMHNKLFEQGVQGGVAAFKQYAEDLGLDIEKFNECLDSGKMASEIQRDMADGQKFGVRGTPAFFVNGEIITGAQPLNVFEQIIDAGLAK